jgi:hypothetical protein
MAKDASLSAVARMNGASRAVRGVVGRVSVLSRAGWVYYDVE